MLAGLRSTTLRRALTSVHRSLFLPPGPWVIETMDGSYYISDSNDPDLVLHCVGIALDAGRGLNNGNPATVSRLIEAAHPNLGETVLHVGAGAGYYSALMAEMVGPQGHVLAAEIDPQLHPQAQANLASWSQVQVVGDALSLTPPPLDVLFFSNGVADLPVSLFQAVKPGGRVILPLTGSIQGGPIFLLLRLDDGSFQSQMVAAQRYYPCLGTRGDAAVAAVDAAIDRSSPHEARRLRLDDHEQGEDCWLHGKGWCFSRT